MADDGRRGDAIEALLDLLVYAPIGLVLDAETVAPDLAKRGRQHTANARQIGELAVKAGRRRLDDVLSQARDTGEETARAFSGSDRSPDDAGDAPDPEARRASADVIDVAVTSEEAASDTEAGPSGDLPIADYDALAASQIVKRLDALSGDELEQVRIYESANRGRRTILSKLARLQG